MEVSSLRIALTADLHYGARHTQGNRSTVALVGRLAELNPDVIILAGDIGAGDDFKRCLALFDGLPGRKLFVPGNHDIWVRQFDERGDSEELFERLLPQIGREHGFSMLDQESALFPKSALGIVGTMNWYDYTWTIDQLKATAPDWEERLGRKRFTRGMHNDANFVRWRYNDRSFTDAIVPRAIQRLDEAIAQVGSVLLVAHHPPVRELLYPDDEPLDLDTLMWRAFSGNVRLEAAIQERSNHIHSVYCGHTHFAVEAHVKETKAYNIGGDYHFKRLLLLDWPNGTVAAEEFVVE